MKPLAFCSRKLNSAQTRYTTGEQELLSIEEALKEFRDIILDQPVIVHTAHLDILYGKLSNECITRWRLILERNMDQMLNSQNPSCASLQTHIHPSAHREPLRS
jgi:hypothetical protein